MVKRADKLLPGAASAAAEHCKDSTFFIRRRNRFWEVIDPAGALVCMTVYKRGAKEVVRRFRQMPMRSEVGR